MSVNTPSDNPQAAQHSTFHTGLRAQVRNDFAGAAEIVAMALEQERQVQDEIVALAKAARAEDDYTGEQFMQWFLAEQVEEISSMTTLPHVVNRAAGDLFHVEDYLIRHTSTAAEPTRAAPRVADCGR